MWLMTFVAISALITVGITTNFYVNTAVSGCSSPVFHRYHGNALVNHVIKTLPLFIADCMTACQETLSCFSINSYNNGFMCDLNRSTKKKSPGSFVRMTGYEYAEAERKLYCKNEQCYEKKVLDGWYTFHTLKFKLINEKKTWQDAKNHCMALGGNLISIQNELESQFAWETINATSTEEYLVNLKMDGTDPSNAISFFKGAKVVDIDNTKAIYFDGNHQSAQIPRFDTTGTDLTFSLWVKAVKVNAVSLFSDFAWSGSQFHFRLIIASKKIKFFLYGVFNLQSTRELPQNTWVLITSTWNRNTKEGKLYFNETLEKKTIVTKENPNPKQTLHATYLIGMQTGSSYPLTGWIRKIFVMKKALNQNEIAALTAKFYDSGSDEVEGIWVGMNDVIAEGTFQWSDGIPLTYSQLQTSSNTNDKDCVLMPKDGNSSSKWPVAKCTEKKPFACEKDV